MLIFVQFANLAAGSGSDVQANSLLESCTKRVVAREPFVLDGRSVTLIDTPGYDQTTDTNGATTLKAVSEFLADRYAHYNDQIYIPGLISYNISYKEGRKLNGILLLHRISDVRVGGATQNDFRRFRKLCGDSTLKNIVIVTTMWDTTSRQAAEQRERELAQTPAFYKPAIDNGALMARHYNTAESAHHILRIVLGFPPELLRIQRELVDEGKTLSGTSAGMDLAVEAKFIEELARAKKQRDVMLQERDELRIRELHAMTSLLAEMRADRVVLEAENKALAEELRAEKEKSRDLKEEIERRGEELRREQAARQTEMVAAAALTRAEISKREKELRRLQADNEAAETREREEARRYEQERLSLLIEKDSTLR